MEMVNVKYMIATMQGHVKHSRLFKINKDDVFLMAMVYAVDTFLVTPSLYQ